MMIEKNKNNTQYYKLCAKQFQKMQEKEESRYMTGLKKRIIKKYNKFTLYEIYRPINTGEQVLYKTCYSN